VNERIKFEVQSLKFEVQRIARVSRDLPNFKLLTSNF